MAEHETCIKDFRVLKHQYIVDRQMFQLKIIDYSRLGLDLFNNENTHSIVRTQRINSRKGEVHSFCAQNEVEIKSGDLMRPQY